MKGRRGEEEEVCSGCRCPLHTAEAAAAEEEALDASERTLRGVILEPCSSYS